MIDILIKTIRQLLLHTIATLDNLAIAIYRSFGNFFFCSKSLQQNIDLPSCSIPSWLCEGQLWCPWSSLGRFTESSGEYRGEISFKIAMNYQIFWGRIFKIWHFLFLHPLLLDSVSKKVLCKVEKMYTKTHEVSLFKYWIIWFLQSAIQMWKAKLVIL